MDRNTKEYHRRGVKDEIAEGRLAIREPLAQTIWRVMSTLQPAERPYLSFADKKNQCSIR